MRLSIHLIYSEGDSVPDLTFLPLKNSAHITLTHLHFKIFQYMLFVVKRK